MIEEEFDIKHLDIITRHLDEHLSGFPKRVWGENGPIEYFFEGWHHYEVRDDAPKMALSISEKGGHKLFGLMMLTLSIMPDQEQVKITIIPTPVGRLNEMISDLKSKITWSGAITCPHCKARYVYQESEKESGSVACKNCAKAFDVQ